jgi:hypothetical protein
MTLKLTDVASAGRGGTASVTLKAGTTVIVLRRAR